MTVASVVPGVETLRTYHRSWLPKDLVAGLILTALLVPQGMAYAELAGLPAITGLYTSILCLLGYAMFGPSRILVLGPDSSLGPMIAATLAPLLLADGDPDRAIALASALALIVGAVTILAGAFHLGFVADLLSKPTQIGYMNGLALTILVGQLPKLFGFSVDADGLIDEATGFVQGVADGDVVGVAALIGLASLGLILVLQRTMPKVPAVLIVVVLAIVAVEAFDLVDHGVAVVGSLPQGFPPFTIPDVSLTDIAQLLPGALGIALVALVDTISTASAFAERGGDRIRGNQEMIGIGSANVAAGLFQGFPVSTSGSRTAVAEQAGAKTQVAGLVGAIAITLILLLVPGPPAGSAAADARRRGHRGVAVAGRHPRCRAPVETATGRMSPSRSRRSWASPCWGSCRASPSRSRCRSTTCSADRGGPTRRPWDGSTVCRVCTTRSSTPRRQLMPGLVVFRFDAPLIFANARTFRERITAFADETPDLRWILIAAEPITDVDTTSADMLEDLDEMLNARGISLVFAEMKDPVREKIERYGLTRTIDPAHFYPTVGAAVDAYQAETGARWGPSGEART